MSNIYGNGTTTASAGVNTVTHFYDMAGVKAANAVSVYGQFADKKSMMNKHGRTYKISKFLHMYDRNPFTNAEFAAKGFLSARTIDALNDIETNAGLSEGAGVENQVTLEKVTMEVTLARYGEMLSYTDEVELFSEDDMQVKYREELGELANRRFEDLIQRDMLATGTVMYSGSATSMAEIGDGVADDGSYDG